MRNLNERNAYRRQDAAVIRIYGSYGDRGNGVFEVPSKTDRRTLQVIASDLDGWDHVSVSRKKRIPNWIEMEQIKLLFFADDETAMQLHVPPTDHINHHPYCLHLWRPQAVEIPRPPADMVGPLG